MMLVTIEREASAAEAGLAREGLQLWSDGYMAALSGSLERVKREAVNAALERKGGNVAAAARDLGVSRSLVYRYREEWS